MPHFYFHHSFHWGVLAPSRQTAQQTSTPVINEDSFSHTVISHCSLRHFIFICKRGVLTLIKGKMEMCISGMAALHSSVMPGVGSYINMSPSPILYLFLSCGCISSVLTPHALFGFFSAILPDWNLSIWAWCTNTNVYNITQVQRQKIFHLWLTCIVCMFLKTVGPMQRDVNKLKACSFPLEPW